MLRYKNWVDIIYTIAFIYWWCLLLSIIKIHDDKFYFTILQCVKVDKENSIILIIKQQNATHIILHIIFLSVNVRRGCPFVFKNIFFVYYKMWVCFVCDRRVWWERNNFGVVVADYLSHWNFSFASLRLIDFSQILQFFSVISCMLLQRFFRTQHFRADITFIFHA